MLDELEVLLGRELGLRVALIENLTRSLHGSRYWRMLQDRSMLDEHPNRWQFLCLMAWLTVDGRG